MSYFGHYPSIELQALAFTEQVKHRQHEDQSTDTEWNGFAVELAYVPGYKSDGRLIGTALVICNISVPTQYQCSRWLLHYCKLCTLLAEDALVVFSTHDWIEDALAQQQPHFELAGTRMWWHEKHKKPQWPLSTPR